MVSESVLKNPKVDAAFGMHVWPSFQTGTVGNRADVLMGASDRLFLTVKGKVSYGVELRNGTVHAVNPETQGKNAVLHRKHCQGCRQGNGRRLSPSIC